MASGHPYAIITCDACNEPLGEESGGSGLLSVPRGDEVHYEEPGLCERCGLAVGMTAMVRWAEEEEEG